MIQFLAGFIVAWIVMAALIGLILVIGFHEGW